MFTSVLIANRGEIAVRIIRTLRRLGVTSIAVYSDADADARHVRDADRAVRIGPANALQSYLSIEAVLAAAETVGAQAIHPGYGFLSENAEFARACQEANLVFVGPSPATIDVMGDKIRAKDIVSAAGVPVVPGVGHAGMTDSELVAAATSIGVPLLVKPSGGGGGKGMRVVEDIEDLPAALASARREASSSFGDDTLLLERYIRRPRHIEVQVMADAHGATLYLGDRECSLQRRHQKVIEEAPSPFLDDDLRRMYGELAVQVANSVDYLGAGTVEFIVDGEHPTEPYFIETNTRLQVEHPVTELITGLDLVEMQLRVASGEPLSIRQSDVHLEGHAIEARIYAEDPTNGFLPTGGSVLRLREPAGDGVRVDSSLDEGSPIATAYDPMISKLIAWGPDRSTALARLDTSLAETAILGCTTNIAFLRRLIALPDVQAGQLDTGLLERSLDQLIPGPPGARHYAAFALDRLASVAGPDPWDSLPGWRTTEAPSVTWEIGSAREVVTYDGDTLTIDGKPHAIAGTGELVTVDGVTAACLVASDGEDTWVAADGVTHRLTISPPRPARSQETLANSEVHSPMPGSIIAVNVTPGDSVDEATPLVIVEAMKMEHQLRSPMAGRVELFVAVGQQVTLGQLIARIELGESGADQ